MAEHARQRQPDRRAFLVARPRAFSRRAVVLASMELRIAQDGVAAGHIECQRLSGQPGRGRQRHRRLDPVREARGPRQRLVSAHGAADDRAQFADAQLVHQPALDIHDVAGRDRREVRAVGLAGGEVPAARAGGAAAAAEDVRADDKELASVNGLPGTDGDFPPARIVPGMMPRDVRIAAQRMTDQHRVVAAPVQPAVGLVRHRDAVQAPAHLKIESASKPGL